MRHNATSKGAKAIYLFIAELNGFKNGTPALKEAYGQQCYLQTKLHDLNYEVEDDRSEANENIWLQRLYDNLDAYYQLPELLGNIFKQRVLSGKQPFATLEANANPNYRWTCPVELDASASMLQYIGVLLNDRRLMSMTNLIGSTLSDPWAFDMPRQQFKDAATPRLYGSSRACHELWADNGHKYTLDQVRAFNNELASGPLGLADQFKEFIINNCTPTAVMQLHVFDEQFTVECNRYRNVGEQTLRYDIYDTETRSIRRIHHTTTKRVPDLQQFRRYFVTGLIHNLDSQVANEVIGKVVAKYGWGMDIHDAFIVNPEAAEDTRLWYAEALESIHANRATILTNYFRSIGIGAEAQGQWNKIKSMVVEHNEPFKCNPMALK